MSLADFAANTVDTALDAAKGFDDVVGDVAMPGADSFDWDFLFDVPGDVVAALPDIASGFLDTAFTHDDAKRVSDAFFADKPDVADASSVTFANQALNGTKSGLSTAWDWAKSDHGKAALAGGLSFYYLQRQNRKDRQFQKSLQRDRQHFKGAYYVPSGSPQR